VGQITPGPRNLRPFAQKEGNAVKLVTRSIIALLFLVVFASSSKAQNPNVAVRLDASKNCVKINLKNLRSIPVTVAYVEFWIYDAKTCKRICVNRKSINKSIKACDTLDVDICCNHLPDAPGYIYYVRVRHSAGQNEAWAFTP
jgi:hypothetical protein